MNHFFRKINNKLSQYPSLRFSYTNNKFVKKFYMNFNMFFVKKNKNMKKFFIEKQINVKQINTHYDLMQKSVITNQHLDSLNQNGIVVLENALTTEEHSKIKKNFDEFKIDLENDNLDKYKNNKLNVVKNKNLASSYTIFDDLNEHSNLRKINDFISKEIYGQITKPLQRYEYKKINNLPDPLIYGENDWHADRYIPNLKFLYFPYDVLIDGAPHKYAIGSHKISKDYMNFFLNKTGPANERRTIKSSNEKETFLKKAKEFPVKGNTLIAVLTNGFHARSPFKSKGERYTLVLQNDDYKIQSIISYSNSL